MELYWKNAETDDYNDGTGLDLSDVWFEPDVIDADTMFLAVIHHIALWAMEGDHSMDDIKGFTLDNDGDELEIDSDAGNWTWLKNVCQVVEYTEDRKNYLPTNAILASIKNEGWKWFDFDSLKDLEDTYSQQFYGDYTEFAKEQMSSLDENLPEHLEYYFNYQDYGEHLIESDYEKLDFADEEFLFHNP